MVTIRGRRNMRLSNRTIIRSILFALAGSASGCDYFDDVTVPATDTKKPTAVAAVWQADEYLAFSSGTSQPLLFEVDPDEGYVMIGAGMDSGGTKKITISRGYQTSCINGGFIETAEVALPPIVKTQPGGVGQEVSNGIWDGELVVLSDFLTCSAGSTPTQVDLTWTVTAEDFHGNKQVHGPATMRADF